MKNFNRKKLVKVLFLLLFGISLLVGISFAIFSESQTQTNNNIISATNCFSISENGTSSPISLSGSIPMSETVAMQEIIPYTFKVTNDCSNSISYVKIGFVDDHYGNTSYINPNFIRTKLDLHDETSSSSVLLGTRGTFDISSQNAYYIAGYKLAKGQSITFDLRIWLDESANFSIAGKTFSGKVAVIAASDAENANDYMINYPSKGDIITMNIGTNLPNNYRVMKTNGFEAEVLAMSDYNIGTAYKFDADGATTTFTDGTVGQQYAGSDVDILLNTAFYNAMNNDSKSAIIPQNINQSMYGYTTTAPTSGTQGINYWQCENGFSTSTSYYLIKIGNDTTSSYINIGNRYIYLLDVNDILNYFDNASFNQPKINMLFYNQTTQFNTNNIYGHKYLWLRSANAYNNTGIWYTDGTSGSLNRNSFDNTYGVRPAFTIDLSKIEWAVTS